MSKKYNNLDSTFETEFIENDNFQHDCIETEIVERKSDNKVNTMDDLKKDYDYSRGNLYSIIEKGQEALNGILELAQESDQPRAYEVAGQLIKSVSDATEKLIDLQKKIKDLDEDKRTSKNPTNVTNALFVGSTAELSKFLKSQSNNN